MVRGDEAAQTAAAGRAAGSLALVVATTLWGANHVVARAIHTDVSLAALVFWRWALALSILVPCVWPVLRREWPAIRAHARFLTTTGAFGVGVFSILLFGAAYATFALEVGLMQATTPIWALVLARVSGGEQLGLGRAAGVVLALLGTLVIVTRGELRALVGLEVSFGGLLALVAAVVFAWYSIRARLRPAGIGLVSFMTCAGLAGLLLAALPFYVWSLVVGEPWLLRSGAVLGTDVLLAAVGFVALGPTLVANLLWVFGVGRLGAGTAGVYLYLAPVASVTLAVLFLGESLRWYHVAGVLPIVAGLVLVNRLRLEPTG